MAPYTPSLCRATLSLLQTATAAPASLVEQTLAAALDESVLVVEPGAQPAVRFRHDRIREAVLQRLAPGRRASLQFAMARRLARDEELFAVAAEQYLAVLDAVDDAGERRVVGGTVAMSTTSDNGTSSLRVVNTGGVIPPDQVERRLLPFTRLDDRTRHDGFGLGLALVSSVATVHGGTVDATAVPTGGLDVTVRLPVATPTFRPGGELVPGRDDSGRPSARGDGLPGTGQLVVTCSSRADPHTGRAGD